MSSTPHRGQGGREKPGVQHPPPRPGRAGETRCPSTPHRGHGQQPKLLSQRFTNTCGKKNQSRLRQLLRSIKAAPAAPSTHLVVVLQPLQRSPAALNLAAQRRCTHQQHGVSFAWGACGDGGSCTPRPGPRGGGRPASSQRSGRRRLPARDAAAALPCPDLPMASILPVCPDGKSCMESGTLGDCCCCCCSCPVPAGPGAPEAPPPGITP